MAAFSYQQHPFHLDSVFFPNPLPVKMSAFLEEPNTSCFSQFYHPLEEVSASVHGSSCLEQSTNNEPSVTHKQGSDSSSAVLGQVAQKVTSMDKKRKFNSAQSKDTREVKGKKGKKNIEEKRADKKKEEEKKKAPEEAPTGYIHVRARRGQATDSHSLAERVRREKISERMKLLQGLVPGCDKVTGKALMLDEIINYVQSLQNQVEFLSMKLASVNPMFYDFGMDLDALMVKPEKMSTLEELQPNMQQCNSPNQSTALSNTFTTPNNYPLLDNPAALLLFQQGQMPNILSPQCNGQVLWDMDEQRHRIISQSGFSNNLCSFH